MITLFSLIITIVGALNWLMVGAFQIDLVALIGGGVGGTLARIIYVIVGIAGLWLFANLIRKKGKISKI